MPEPLEFSYGFDGFSRIQIKKTNSNFFEKTEPQPKHILWKDWQDKPLPLFFDDKTTQEWLTQDEQGNTIISYDLIASSFYLLSGWQEYYGKERDQFDRFPYQASVQSIYSFVTTPVVNYYFDILREAVQAAYGQEVKIKNWNGKPFATCLTHDIDYIQSAWKVAGKPALLKGSLPIFLKLLWKKLRGKEAWFNISEVAKELEKLNAKGTFYFLPEHASHHGHPNSDYKIEDAYIQQEIEKLAAAGHEIAVHGSHGTGANKEKLKAEIQKLELPISGNRFHYLRFDPAHSTAILEELNLHYDSSLGFSEHFGFRNSYCQPFKLFHFQDRRMSSVWQLPLNLMDITLHHPRYLQLKPSEVMPAITPMLEEIIRFSGVFTLLWHNENFSTYGLPNGLTLFQEITAFLQKQQTAFLTASEALDQVS